MLTRGQMQVYLGARLVTGGTIGPPATNAAGQNAGCAVGLGEALSLMREVATILFREEKAGEAERLQLAVVGGEAGGGKAVTGHFAGLRERAGNVRGPLIAERCVRVATA